MRWRPKMALPWMSHVLFVEVLHPVDFDTITHVISLNETADLSKFIARLRMELYFPLYL